MKSFTRDENRKIDLYGEIIEIKPVSTEAGFFYAEKFEQFQKEEDNGSLFKSMLGFAESVGLEKEKALSMQHNHFMDFIKWLLEDSKKK